MKKIIISLMSVIFAVAFSACDDDNNLPDVVPSDQGTVTDGEGNTYAWVRIGNLLWTTSNADNGPLMDDYRYFDNNEYKDAFSKSRKKWLQQEYHPVYGNLMTWDDAMESAPEGWRVPTDQDWQELERTLGMENAAATGWRGENGVGFRMQDKDSGCRLGLQLGGFMTVVPSGFSWITITLDFTGEYGAYWTSSLDDSALDHKTAWYRKVHCSNGGVDRVSGRCDKLMAVRWCRNAM